ncbi:uncharacterized protein [Physcomitrium patens]|uniref:Uncharacterized protein n=1 Tax=Physcomitrium patens TaxID=3218 RepID=A0A2K1L727_PHYPA|nr:putative ciliary rootlet coiled-coil protein 2 [Physcomitrium patens]PNR61848.1 hypothetical protein PHYPA_000272 [Physcomitrium patens]|eukprot:XP_024381402.1 putative ciliary rootlet coiled-coil protein 2 [Physcomitrella patens]
MAGLLAWAADVVVGNGSESADRTLHFTPQQRQAVSALDARAAALQHSLQLLRQRMPPSNIAQRLPHLHADSLASHSALALEKHAHSATLNQLQAREASLQAENENYAKALAARQQHAREKAQETLQLAATLEEIEATEVKLRADLERLQKAVALRDGLASSAVSTDKKGLQDDSKRSDFSAIQDVSTLEEQELQSIKLELARWEGKVIRLEKEWEALQHNTSRTPSPAQREKELERRLRTLTEQLVTKQAQAESLANERNALELRLVQANEARQNLLSGNGDLDFKRNKIGRSSSGLSSQTATLALEIASQRSAVIRQRGAKVTENVARVARTVDAFSMHAGSQLRRSMLMRTLTVCYVLGLHVVVLLILSSVGLGRLH